MIKEFSDEDMIALWAAEASLFVRQSALDKITGEYLRIGVSIGNYVDLAIYHAKVAQAHRLERVMLFKELKAIDS